MSSFDQIKTLRYAEHIPDEYKPLTLPPRNFQWVKICKPMGKIIGWLVCITLFFILVNFYKFILALAICGAIAALRKWQDSQPVKPIIQPSLKDKAPKIKLPKTQPLESIKMNKNVISFIIGCIVILFTGYLASTSDGNYAYLMAVMGLLGAALIAKPFFFADR